LFVTLYAIISAFPRVPLFLPNYSLGKVKTNNIRPFSACLALFEAIWHFLQVVWHFCSLGPGNPDRHGKRNRSDSTNTSADI